MRFTELLRVGALLSGASATVIAGATVAFGYDTREQRVVLLCTLWWLICVTAALIVVSRRAGEPSESIERLLADARPQRNQEEPRIGRTVASRLWPLGLATFLAVAGGAVLGPQVPGGVAGFPIVWALLWRAQEYAVKAVEERDGVVFHVVPTGPLSAIKVVRGPGLRREQPVSPHADEARSR
ncbi:MAG: hypothetical protein J7513_06700 [Solirubrobacteraceae bacterium]|nr:hypothetical protein [Solirubrobacteraceae bacterium]